MLEAKFFNWKSDESRKLLQQLSLKINDENIQIGKASAQCLLSMCRTEGIKITASMLSIGFLQKLKDFLINTVVKLPNADCQITPDDINEMIDGLRKKPKEHEVKEVKEEEPKKEIKIIDMSTQNNAHQRRLEKIKKAIGNE